MAAAITKVYLDSRYSIDGKSFDFQNVGLLLHPKSRCWLSEFTCVASWDTLDASNSKFVVTEGTVNRTITLPTGPHDIDSLGVAIQNALNAGKPANMGTYSVDKVGAASGTTFRSCKFRLQAPSDLLFRQARILSETSLIFPAVLWPPSTRAIS